MKSFLEVHIYIGIFILDVAVVCTTCLTMHRRINDLSQNGVGVTQIKGHRYKTFEYFRQRLV